MSARKPRARAARATPAEAKLNVPTPRISVSRRAGRFKVEEELLSGVEPGDLDKGLDRQTGTSREARQLARLDLYLRELATGVVADEAFFGVGILLDVPAKHPWRAFCELDESDRPIGLKPAMREQLRACVEAFRTARRGRHALGMEVPPSRATQFKQLATALGLVSEQTSPDYLKKLLAKGKRALAAGK